MPNAQDEAIVLAAVQRRLLDPELILQARERCQSQGSGMAVALREWIEPAQVGALLSQLARDVYRCPSRDCRPIPFGELVAQDRMRCSSCERPLVRAKGEELVRETAADLLSAPTTEATWGRARRMGPYLLLEEVGRGSMGVVFLARRDDLPRRLALKVVLTQENDPESLARFQREAAVAARLQHPGIVGVYDVGREGRYRYYAMDYCDGKTLREVLREGPLPPLEAVRMVLELARAIDYAHQQGVFHRDLKPANVLIDPHSGRPRVTDFGLAQDASRRERLTKTGDILGTPLYMSPEQTVGQKGSDGHFDVYALGVILYECLTGTPPFMHTDPQQLFRMIREGKPDPPRKLAPEVPLELERICLRAMHSNPAQRTARAGLLAAELEAFLEAPTASASPRRFHVALVGGIGILAGVAVAIVALSTRGGDALASVSPSARRTPVATPSPSAPPSLAPSQTPAALPPEVDRELTQLAAASVFPFHRAKSPQLRERFRRMRARGPVLTERYPQDSRAIFLGAINDLLLRTSRDLEVRRQFLRAIRSAPPLPEDAYNLSVLTIWSLGFDRAAADLCEPGIQRARPDASCALNLLHIQMKAAPPVRDLPRAIEVAEAALRLREASEVGMGNQLLVPTWDLHCNLAELYLVQGDSQRAAQGYQTGAGFAEGRRREGFLARAAAIRSGQLTRADGTRNITTMIGFTPFGEALAKLEQLENRSSALAAAVEANAAAEKLERAGQLNKAALTRVHAGRALLRAERVGDAIKALRLGAKLNLPPADADVRALVCRTLAHALLLAPLGASPSADNLSEARGLATEAIAAARGKPEDFTRGELADAWVLLGRAEHFLGATSAAKAAHAAALALEPYDRRELDRLGKSLGLR